MKYFGFVKEEKNCRTFHESNTLLMLLSTHIHWGIQLLKRFLSVYLYNFIWLLFFNSNITFLKKISLVLMLWGQQHQQQKQQQQQQKRTRKQKKGTERILLMAFYVFPSNRFLIKS